MCDYGAIFSYHDLASRAETFDLSLSLSDQISDDAGQDAGGMLQRRRRTSGTKIGSRRKPDKGHIKEIILRRVAWQPHPNEVVQVIATVYIEQLCDHCRWIQQYRRVILRMVLGIATTRTRIMTARQSPSYRLPIMAPTSCGHKRFSRDVAHVLCSSGVWTTRYFSQLCCSQFPHPHCVLASSPL